MTTIRSPRAAMLALLSAATVTTTVMAGKPAEPAYMMSDGTSGTYIQPERHGPKYIETYGNLGAAGAGPTFIVEYLDVTNDTGVGFDDPITGATARATVAAVFAYISTVITDTGSADILMRASQTDGTGSLATAGPIFFVADCSIPFAIDHITTGTDPLVGTPDGRVRIDFGYEWNIGLGAPGATEHDLFSVLLHETTHALGFTSSLLTECAPSCCEPIAGPGTRMDGFDQLLEQGATGAALINCDTGLFLGGDLTGGLGGVVVNGPALNAAWADLGGSGSPPLHAPGPFVCGSSMAHWDSSNDTVPMTAVMRPAIAPGVERRVYQPIDSAMLSDIGYTIAVPKPCFGDLDDDGAVGFTDLTTVLTAWGPCPACPEDLNGDNEVGFVDLTEILVNWGACS